MENGLTTGDLLRLVGFMGIAVALAWAFQLLAFARVGSPLDQIMWVMGAAAIAGAGVGMLYISSGMLREPETVGF